MTHPKGSRRSNAPMWSAHGRFSRNRVKEPNKDDLVGQLVVFTVQRHEPLFVTQFGVKPKTIASLYVLSGPLSGEHFPDWSVVGPMASQMASFPAGVPQGARIVRHRSASGRRWVGLDTELIEADRVAISECLGWEDASGSKDGEP